MGRFRVVVTETYTYEVMAEDREGAHQAALDEHNVGGHGGAAQPEVWEIEEVKLNG